MTNNTKFTQKIGNEPQILNIKDNKPSSTRHQLRISLNISIVALDNSRSVFYNN